MNKLNNDISGVIQLFNKIRYTISRFQRLHNCDNLSRDMYGPFCHGVGGISDLVIKGLREITLYSKKCLTEMPDCGQGEEIISQKIEEINQELDLYEYHLNSKYFELIHSHHFAEFSLKETRRGASALILEIRRLLKQLQS